MTLTRNLNSTVDEVNDDGDVIRYGDSVTVKMLVIVMVMVKMVIVMVSVLVLVLVLVMVRVRMVVKKTFQVPDHFSPTLSTTSPHFRLFFNHLKMFKMRRMVIIKIR